KKLEYLSWLLLAQLLHVQWKTLMLRDRDAANRRGDLLPRVARHVRDRDPNDEVAARRRVEEPDRDDGPPPRRRGDGEQHVVRRRHRVGTRRVLRDRAERDRLSRVCVAGDLGPAARVVRRGRIQPEEDGRGSGRERRALDPVEAPVFLQLRLSRHGLLLLVRDDDAHRLRTTVRRGCLGRAAIFRLGGGRLRRRDGLLRLIVGDRLRVLDGGRRVLLPQRPLVLEADALPLTLVVQQHLLAAEAVVPLHLLAREGGVLRHLPLLQRRLRIVLVLVRLVLRGRQLRVGLRLRDVRVGL